MFTLMKNTERMCTKTGTTEEVLTIYRRTTNLDFVCKGIKMMGGFSSLKGEEEETNPVTATVREMLTESRVVEE